MNTVDEYLAQFPKDVKASLTKIRKLIFKLAPDAEEKIAYGMAAYHLNKKPLIYYGGYPNHIGLYGLPATNLKFKKELKVYKCGKGSIQFPLEEPIPYDLISRIIEFRINETSLPKKKIVKKGI